MKLNRAGFVAVALMAAVVPSVSAADQTAEELWRHLPVLDQGRLKPLDTVAREHLRMITGVRGYTEHKLDASGRPTDEVVKKHDPVALYVELILSWGGWDNEPGPGWFNRHPREEYWFTHKADKWDRQPMLLVKWLELRKMLGVPEDQDHVSAEFLRDATVKLPDGEKRFFDWVVTLMNRRGEGEESLNPTEEKAVELASRYMEYIRLRMAFGPTNRTAESTSPYQLGIVPIGMPQRPEDDMWLPLSVALRVTDEVFPGFLGQGYPKEKVSEVRARFAAARTALEQGFESAEFTAASAELREAIADLGVAMTQAREQARQGTSVEGKSDALAYPVESNLIATEVRYNHQQPFLWACIVFTVAAILTSLTFLIRSKAFYWIAVSTVMLGTVLSGYGFVLRAIIARRPAVTNLFETVIWVGFIVCLLGLIFEFMYRQRYFAVAAAWVATLFMILAHNWPTVLDPSITQIEPVLRTNFYLFVHVQTIVASYGAGALAWGLSMLALGIYAFRKPSAEARDLARTMGTLYMYRVVQVAVILLAAGTILGGVWAADSWGRFWGWDPKETWALISLLCYVLVLHGRFTGWWNTFGMAAGANLCFLSILMSWYGVNFVLPIFNEGQAVGLHGYGLGKGGLGYALAVAAADLLYVGYATLRYYQVWRADDAAVEAAEVAEEEAVLV